MASRKKLARAASGALLLAQHRTFEMVRDAARPYVRDAAGRVAGSERRSGRLSALSAASAAMTPAVASALTRGRRAARAGAIRRLDAELEAAGLRPVRVSTLMARAYAERVAEDEAVAQVSAESLVAQWRAAAQAIIATAPEGEYRAGVEKSLRAIESRILRTSVTETALAYNDEHIERVADAVRAGHIDPRSIMREWSAYAEACSRCRPLHGVRVPYGESFPGNEVPGSVHVNCACVEFIVEV